MQPAVRSVDSEATESDELTGLQELTRRQAEDLRHLAELLRTLHGKVEGLAADVRVHLELAQAKLQTNQRE